MGGVEKGYDVDWDEKIKETTMVSVPSLPLQRVHKSSSTMPYTARETHTANNIIDTLELKLCGKLRKNMNFQCVELIFENITIVP